MFGRGARAATLLAAVLWCATSRAQVATGTPPASVAIPHAPIASTGDSTLDRLIDQGMNHSHVDADIEYLLDVIGPRLTGSAEAKRANDWTRQKFLEYGTDDAELEPWTFGVGWIRGPMTLRMLAPQRREILGVSWAWSPGTSGPLAGDVVFMDARTEGEFDKRFGGKLKGAWVLVGETPPFVNAANPPMTYADSVHLDSARRALAPRNDDERQFALYKYGYVAQEKPAGIVHPGGKQFGLFTMSGSPNNISPVPQIVISDDDYDQLERLARRGEHARLEADVSNGFTRETLQSSNTVAELRGTEKPDEVVLLGAHLDSWDLATGGTDNGAGAIAVLEAARILTAAGVHPRRTIRFVLFTGEEQGLLGSAAYAAAHKQELDKFQAVLVLDNGTGRIVGMELQGRDELAGMWRSMFEPLRVLDTLYVRPGNKTGTDHLSFLPHGVPAFNYDQLSRGYDFTHHSQIDDYNYVIPSDIAQAATVMAVNAWQLAQMNELLPRGVKR